MNAVLERIDFSPYMTTLDTLTIRIDAALKRKLEALAEDAHFTLDELVVQMIEASIFRDSPEFFDPNNEEAREFRLVEEGLRSCILGDTVPLEDVMQEMEQRFGAERSKDLPGKR